MMEIHALTGEGETHVMTVYRDSDKEGPLQMISRDKLARLLRIEINYLELLELLAKQEAEA
jgi:hypothetical protein